MAISKRKVDWGPFSVQNDAPTTNSATPNFIGMNEIVIVSCKRPEDDIRDPQDFLVHKNFITAYSPYFNAAFSGASIEGQTQRVELEGVDPEVFAIFINWIYTQQVQDGENEGLMDINKLTTLWLLGQYLVVPKLQADVMKALQTGKFTGFFEYPGKIYENSPKESPLRQFLLNRWVKSWSRGSKPKALYADFPKGFYIEVLEAIRPQEQNPFISAPIIDQQSNGRRTFSADWRRY